jgi:hypothetical protein
VANGPQQSVTIPDNEVIRDEDVVRDGGKSPLADSIGPDTRNPLQRLSDWYTRQSSTYGGTLDRGGQSPRDIAGNIGESAAAGSVPMIGAGLAAAPIATGIGLAGSAIGSYLGNKFGGWAGGKVGAPELGGDIGGITGGAIGGGAGGKLGLAMTPKPPMPPSVGADLFPGASSSASPKGIGEPMPAPMVGPGPAKPNTLGLKPQAPSPFAGATSSASPAGMGTPMPPGPIPQGSPTPFPTVQPKPSLGVAPKLPEPQWFPEPRPETPIDRPGSMWSVGRETLPPRATRGQPGALDVLTNVGDRPPLVTPKPTLGVADPSFSDLRGRTEAIPGTKGFGYSTSQIAPEAVPQAPGGDIPQGSATPFSQLPDYTPEMTDREADDRRLEMRAQRLESDIGKFDRRSPGTSKGPRTPRPGQTPGQAREDVVQ